MRILLALTLVTAAFTGAGAHADCPPANGNVWDCTPAPNPDTRDTGYVDHCAYTTTPGRSFIEASPVIIALATSVTVSCDFGDIFRLMETHEGPVGYITPMVVDSSVELQPICQVVSWTYSDGSTGGESTGSC